MASSWGDGGGVHGDPHSSQSTINWVSQSTSFCIYIAEHLMNVASLGLPYSDSQKGGHFPCVQENAILFNIFI